METIRFAIDTKTINDALTAYDIETFERSREGETLTYRVKRMAARFMVDEQGKPIPYAQALRRIDELSTNDYRETLEKFFQTINEIAVPKANATQSASPSAVSSPATSLTGLQP